MKWYCMVQGCGYSFPDDTDIDARKTAHNQMHVKSPGRATGNIIVGDPAWKLGMEDL